mgnify:CR=1 FL=1
MKEKIKNNKKIVISVLVVFILVIGCVGGYVAKIKYDQKQEKIKQENIEKKNTEIQTEYDKFEKESDRSKKLECVKVIEEEYSKYKKSENKYEECEKEYTNKIDSMNKYIIDDYDKSINDISNEIGKDINTFTDKDKLSSYVTTLTTLKETIKTDYENYSVIDKDKFDEYNETIDNNIKSYNDRLEAIKKKEKKETEKKKAEEAAAKKAAEEAAKAQQQASAAASSDSYVDNGSTGNSGGSYSYDNSGSYDYSGGNNYSYSGGSYDSGSSNSGNSSGGSSNGSYEHWTEFWGNDPNDKSYRNDITGDIYDSNGNYVDNINNWK